MPIDPSIPLQAGQQLPRFGPDWGVIQNALKTQIAMQNQAQVQQAENALKAAYSDPNNFDPNTLALKPNAMVNLAQQAPQAAMEVRNNLLKNQEQQARAGVGQAKILEQYGEQANDIANKARRAYEDALENRVLPAQAQAIGQRVYTEELSRWLPNLPPEIASKVPKNFDIMRVRASEQAWKERQAAQKEARAARGEERAEDREERITKREDVKAELENRRTAVAERKADEPDFKGDVKNEDGTVTPGVPLRAGGPTGFTDATGKPVRYIPSTVYKLGAESSKEFAQSKPVVVLDKDGKTVGTYAGRESTHGVGFVRGDTGEPIAPPEGGKVILGTDKDASEEAKEAAANMVAHYDVAPPPLGSRGTKQNVELLAKAKEINPNYKAEKYYASKALREGYARTTTGSPGFKIGSINTATQHFAVLNELSNKLDNKDPAAANYIINYVRQNILGKENVTDFNIASQVVADEALKAVINAAGGVTDRDKLQAQLTNTRAPTQIKGAVNTLSELMAGQARTLRTQARKNGWSDEDWEGYLEPDAAELLAPYLKEKGKGESAGTRAEPAPAAKGATAQGPVPTPADFGGQKYLTNKQTGETWVIGPDGKVVPYVAGQK